MLAANQQPIWNRWLWRTLRNVLIVLVGISSWYLSVIGIAYEADHLSPGHFRDIFALLAILVAPNLLAGAVIGLAQWAWLWRKEAPLGAWVPMSVVGWTIAFTALLVIQPMQKMLYIVLSQAILGACIGVGQWLLLRRHIRGAGWWILTNAGATAIAWIGFLSYV